MFDCKVYSHIDVQNLEKLDDKAQLRIFVGYDNISKGYSIYTECKNITLSTTVKFLEDAI